MSCNLHTRFHYWTVLLKCAMFCPTSFLYLLIANWWAITQHNLLAGCFDQEVFVNCLQDLCSTQDLLVQCNYEPLQHHNMYTYKYVHIVPSVPSVCVPSWFFCNYFADLHTILFVGIWLQCCALVWLRAWWHEIEGISSLSHASAIATCSRMVGATHQGVLYVYCTGANIGYVTVSILL